MVGGGNSSSRVIFVCYSSTGYAEAAWIIIQSVAFGAAQIKALALNGEKSGY